MHVTGLIKMEIKEADRSEDRSVSMLKDFMDLKNNSILNIQLEMN